MKLANTLHLLIKLGIVSFSCPWLCCRSIAQCSWEWKVAGLRYVKKCLSNTVLSLFLESFMSPRNVGPDRKDQEKDTESSTVNEETSEESNQMEESDQSQAEKDLHSDDSEISGSASSGADCSETEELGSYASETPEISSETPMENSDEATEVADEPMEQD